VVEATIDRLRKPDATPDAFRDQFATLTLGSGAVAMVVCRRDLATTGHTMANGSVTRAATRHCRLCLGQRDRMTADAAKVLIFGVELGQADLGAGQPHPESTGAMREIDAYMPHQVSRRNMDVLNEKLGLTPEKHHLNFPTLGNIGPAAVPITLCQAAESGRLRPGGSRGAHGHWQRSELLDDEPHLVGRRPFLRNQHRRPVAFCCPGRALLFSRRSGDHSLPIF
jgi:hypothetical protein